MEAEKYFNPRSPRGGATQDLLTAIPAVGKFQSTLPTRGSDLFSLYFYSYIKISIHAPHEGERLELSTYPVMQYDFNPRSPRGGATHPGAPFWQACQYFNPRSPRGGATPELKKLVTGLTGFQSTLPTRGSDKNGV